MCPDAGTLADIPQWVDFKGINPGPELVFISGDEEYRSEEALPQLAKILATHHGFTCRVLFAQDPRSPGLINANFRENIPGLEALARADLMIIFTRYRELPDHQMAYIDAYLKQGKPVLGIRTSTHAFHFGKTGQRSAFVHYGKAFQSDGPWNGGFGTRILGQNWIAHHGRHRHQSTRGRLAPDALAHPILNGIGDGDIWGPTDVYRARYPVPNDWQVLVLGEVLEREGPYMPLDPLYGMRPGDTLKAQPQADSLSGKLYDPNDPMMPIAWTREYEIHKNNTGRVFTSTIGASVDLLAEGTRRLLVNAVFWCLGQEVPSKAQVDLVGEYNPSRFEFGDDEVWKNRNLRVSDFLEKAR